MENEENEICLFLWVVEQRFEATEVTHANPCTIYLPKAKTIFNLTSEKISVQEPTNAEFSWALLFASRNNLEITAL